MSVKNLDVAFQVRDGGRDLEFCGIREVGFNERGGFIISAWTTPFVATGEPRGGWTTVLPISGLGYRARRPTKTAFERGASSIIIYDDWGTSVVITATADVLDQLAAECAANSIPEKQISDARPSQEGSGKP